VSALVPIAHTVLAAVLALYAVLGVAALGSSMIVGLLVIVMPLLGAVLFATREWQVGRGPWTARLADVAALAFAVLFAGQAGTLMWLLAVVAACAAVVGFVGTLTTDVPRRAGWRL
jgi:hypothetical protein